MGLGPLYGVLLLVGFMFRPATLRSSHPLTPLLSSQHSYTSPSTIPTLLPSPDFYFRCLSACPAEFLVLTDFGACPLVEFAGRGRQNKRSFDETSSTWARRTSCLTDFGVCLRVELLVQWVGDSRAVGLGGFFRLRFSFNARLTQGMAVHSLFFLWWLWSCGWSLLLRGERLHTASGGYFCGEREMPAAFS